MFAEVRDKEDNRSAGIKQLLRNMGATVHDTLDKGVTHVIFREGQLSTYKKAKKQNCHLLSMLWLHAVRNTGRRVPEQNYPALNLDLYESPVANKKFRKIKSMQPDYENVREDYHRKRLEKVFKQKLAGISSTNGSDSDDIISTTSTSKSRKRKSDILPDKKINNSKRRRTIMSTTTMESDTDENKSRKQNKSNQRRKTEFISSSSILSTIDDNNILKERNTLKEKNVLTKHTSSVLENRNVVVNQTLRPSAVIDLVQGSQDLFSNPIELKHKKNNEQLNEKQDDEDNDLTKYSANIKDRNVVVNCTLTPPRFEDVLDRSQDIIEKNIKEEVIPPRSPSISSDTTSQDNDCVDSPDLRKVLDAIQNDNSGSLRKKLLKGLGIKCPSDKKRESIKKTPKKAEEVFSFVTVRRKTNNFRFETEDDNDISRNKTASTIFGESPLKHRNDKIEKEPTEKQSTRTRTIKTPSRYLDGIENNEASSVMSTGRRKTINVAAPQSVRTEENDKKNKPTKRRARLFLESDDESAIEKSKEEKKFLVNDSENDEDAIKGLNTNASKILEKINTIKESKPTRRKTQLFQESKDNSTLEKSKEDKNSLVGDSENDSRIGFKENKPTRRKTKLFQESTADSGLEKSKNDKCSLVSESENDSKIRFKENKPTRRKTQLFQESKVDSDPEESKNDKSSLVSDSLNDSKIKKSRINNLDKKISDIPRKKNTMEENKSTKRRTRLLKEYQDESDVDKSNEKNLINSPSDKCGLETKQSATKNLDKKVRQKRYEVLSSDEESLKDVINKRVAATEPRRKSAKRIMIPLHSNEASSSNGKFPDIQEEAASTNQQTVLKSKSPKQKTKKIPATEPSKRKDTSRLNSTVSRKVKLFDPTLDMVDSDLSLPEVTETVENPYGLDNHELENKTPKRRKVDLKDDKNRRSTFWFQTAEERQMATQTKKSTQNFKASQKKLPTIVCTRLHGDQIDIFNQIVKKLGGFEIENNVSSATTHLVVGEASRTLNMLRAIIRGCWIVNYEWLLQSLEAGQWLQEELYEVTEFSPAVKKCRIERQTFGEPYAMNLFNECGKIYIGTQTSPKNSDLEQLVKLAGGTVATSPRLARIIVGQTYSNADNDVVCVTEKWVLESISHKSVKSFKHFLLSTNNEGNSS
ncbi:microcephalin isoform X2 [Chrysoperla carnea]|nr:microcephalin isoform X2 [Chrysoperla carnea]